MEQLTFTTRAHILFWEGNQKKMDKNREMRSISVSDWEASPGQTEGWWDGGTLAPTSQTPGVVLYLYIITEQQRSRNYKKLY